MTRTPGDSSRSHGSGHARDHAADVAALEANLSAVDIATDPDGWALAAYRLGVARSEMASSRQELVSAVDVLEKAARVLSAERAPLEHGRILTAVGNCQRMSGRPDLAAATFERSAELLVGRCDVVEQGAALVNVGLARTEAGDGATAIEALDAAVAVLDQPADRSMTDGDDEQRRALGAALLNRAQAHQALGQDDHLAAAVTDYKSAVSILDPESPQAAMAWHGQATALLEQARRSNSGDSTANIDAAIAAIQQSITVFTFDGFPFQHGVARHSLAVAFQLRAGRRTDTSEHDLSLATHHGEMALGIFDPRLHQSQWRTVKSTLDEVATALAPATPSQSLVNLMATVDEDQRTTLFRDRLGRLAAAPEVAMTANLQRLADALADSDPDVYQTVAQSMLSVLMELPDQLLTVAARCLVDANQRSGDPESANKALDDAIHDRLFGPQRVRVRDLLAATGWERP